LLPKAVLKVHSEAEVVQLLQLAQRHQVPVTFRAAGTSLSGQAITDSILIKVGWQFHSQHQTASSQAAAMLAHGSVSVFTKVCRMAAYGPSDLVRDMSD
jgi:FAD/FMN-containing dehydrogenase